MVKGERDRGRADAHVRRDGQAGREDAQVGDQPALAADSASGLKFKRRRWPGFHPAPTPLAPDAICPRIWLTNR
jgi:hypothetical protein